MAMITGFFRDSFRSIVRTEAGIDRLFSFSGGCQDSLSFSRGFVDALAFLQNPRLPPGMPFVYLFIYSSEILFKRCLKKKQSDQNNCCLSFRRGGEGTQSELRVKVGNLRGFPHSPTGRENHIE